MPRLPQQHLVRSIQPCYLVDECKTLIDVAVYGDEVVSGEPLATTEYKASAPHKHMRGLDPSVTRPEGAFQIPITELFLAQTGAGLPASLDSATGYLDKERQAALRAAEEPASKVDQDDSSSKVMLMSAKCRGCGHWQTFRSDRAAEHCEACGISNPTPDRANYSEDPNHRVEDMVFDHQQNCLRCDEPISFPVTHGYPRNECHWVK